ncbi:hypothetical protein CEXT_602291 [Caerostris extrusa]|uniref:Uncharacterized protein n=1 Tax=Caerostris extrusa TaxID=172846 RepID=A0AAV4SMD7_CAEEX|nr:hypothetical protein CEXT_602291 [Caerostris extrusa]
MDSNTNGILVWNPIQMESLHRIQYKWNLCMESKEYGISLCGIQGIWNILVWNPRNMGISLCGIQGQLKIQGIWNILVYSHMESNTNGISWYIFVWNPIQMEYLGMSLYGIQLTWNILVYPYMESKNEYPCISLYGIQGINIFVYHCM